MALSHDRCVYLPQKSHGRLSSSPTCIEHVAHSSPTWTGFFRESFLPCFFVTLSSACETDLLLIVRTVDLSTELVAILQSSAVGFVQSARHNTV